MATYSCQVPEQVSRGKKEQAAAPWEELSQLYLSIQNSALFDISSL